MALLDYYLLLLLGEKKTYIDRQIFPFDGVSCWLTNKSGLNQVLDTHTHTHTLSPQNKTPPTNGLHAEVLCLQQIFGLF